ncbi:hypothetical protein S7711_05485 [Stachybotrys chartarum IBT 7711]|uniref:Uncharacterized protein n=1 Tax=Stachybotrys chartarum (strain CBS 109288 / IBT 7711) TaxID=1280523 RepID=A0A084BB14_STACB|nr:hypothetical protein S7711_05485 [Stachybotrys chartarum IBT 7711]
MTAEREDEGGNQAEVGGSSTPASHPAIAQQSIAPAGTNTELYSTRRALSLVNAVALARLLTGYLVARLMPMVNATFTIARCCTLAVREQFDEPDYIQWYPWDACSFNTDIDYGSEVQFFPSVRRSMAWARENCRGTQYSSLEQWLVPLSTYISPYIGILLLCPVGDVLDKEFFTTSPWKHSNAVINGFRKPVQEYMRILGDPASALFGACYEVWSDAMTLSQIRPEDKHTMLHQSALWITALAGDIRYSRNIRWHSQAGQALEKGPDQTDTYDPHGITSTTTKAVPSSESHQLANDPPTEGERMTRAIDLVIAARKGFVSGILIPVLLLLAVTAATFYDAYTRRGDKETGLALAYCTWYSWILVLGMAGNCYASALSPSFAKKAFNHVLYFDKDCLSTPLSDRYINNYLWQAWAYNAEGTFDYGSFHVHLKDDWKFWLRFSLGKLIGFCIIGFSSGCAIAIAWTTPTVGLGCRSFNFIIYAVGSFITAYLQILCAWLEVRAEAKRSSSETPIRRSRLLLSVQLAYWFFVLVNTLIMILGTLFHMVGVFRTCWCEQLTWSSSTLIELNNKTPEAVENAGRYWLSTAYVAFGMVWLACLTAMSFRRVIIQKMEAWANARHEAMEGDGQTD